MWLTVDLGLGVCGLAKGNYLKCRLLSFKERITLEPGLVSTWDGTAF